MIEAIQVIDTAHLVRLPGGALLAGAPPEALKVLVLWEYPLPSTVVLPPDPLYADGINQASFEFLLYNHMFRLDGLRDRVPFTLVCDPEQAPRMEKLVREMLRGPSAEQMDAWRTPASHRKQLLREFTVVSGGVAKLRLDQMARVLAFENGRVTLPDGTLLESLPPGELRVTHAGESVVIPRQAVARQELPFIFGEVEAPVAGPRFGLQVIGSGSGFSGSDWSSCFIIWINGQPLIVDGTPYLDDHLRRLGIEDDHILGYLVTHTHEDHANALGQWIGRRPITILTSGPVMSGLVMRLAAILGIAEAEVRRLVRWVPLHPGLEGLGEPLNWFGAEIRTWYSVHTLPTLGVDVSMGGKRIRMPGDTLWGRQLDPLLEQQVISPARHHFIQHSYDGADLIVADAGGGPIHPDPEEVHELLGNGCACQLMVTHLSEAARELLPNAEPGAVVTLLPRQERTSDQAMALFSAPLLREAPERWLAALLQAGEVIDPPEAPIPHRTGAAVVLSGRVAVRDGETELMSLQRGDLFHHSLLDGARDPILESTAKWTRWLCIPEELFHAFVQDTGLGPRLLRLYRTRSWWRSVVGIELGLDTLVALSELCRERRLHAGATIVRQGERASEFYVVTSGCVEVLQETASGTRSLGCFGPGYYFGEIALLDEEVRTATIRAEEETELLALPARAFQKYLMNIPIARWRVVAQATRRKAELDR